MKIKRLLNCFIVSLLIVLLSGEVKPAFAEGFGEVNNIFGIHILESSDLGKAQELVNSSGGDWGYVTMVMREDDLDKDKWQHFMDDCRRLHLIPIIRLATRMEPNGNWAKPTEDDLKIWHEFLNSLNWPVKQQIVTVFNEPNHAREWGGEINPREYAVILDKLINLLKTANPNFFVLNAGLDQAADGRNGTMDEAYFLSEMRAGVGDIFNKLDGWASHSYPNHGFVGSPNDTGRHSISGYVWELAMVKNLGGTKELPVFITETGWPHLEGVTPIAQFYESNKVAQNMEKAFSIWENDSRIKAVTPFVLNYPADPFEHFAWLKKDNETYEQFDVVRQISKPKAEPEQVSTYSITNASIPDLLPTDYSAKAKITVRNTGQWIMGERGDINFQFSIRHVADNFQNKNGNDCEQKESGFENVVCKNEEQQELLSLITLVKGELIYPGEEKTLDFILSTGKESGEMKLEIAGQSHTIYIYKPFELTNAKVSIFRQMVNRLKLWWLEWSEK